jgi:adenylate cyclase
MTDGAAWILVVDDDPVNRSLLTRLLEQDGHRVDTAADGRQALERLNGDPFDLVLLDILMPKMDGYEVLARMKGDDVLRRIPVVMITSIEDVQSAVKCIESGADDYLPKPFDPVVLRARLRASLAKKRMHDLELEHLVELNRLNRRLEARIEEQMAELVRTGELKRFLPQQVAEVLLAGQLEPDEGFVRRRITVLFADLVGFTDLADTLEPEELAHVLNEYLRETTAIAFANGGVLEHFFGDALLVKFGAPVPSEERVQAIAAARTAIGMRACVREVAARLHQRAIPADLQIRVGINTGHCTLGVFGSDAMRVYMAHGLPVNIAVRLQTEAEPGAILCGFRTYALLQDRVRAVPCGSLTLKGAARPVEAWEILELVDGQAEDVPGSDAAEGTETSSVEVGR